MAAVHIAFSMVILFWSAHALPRSCRFIVVQNEAHRYAHSLSMSNEDITSYFPGIADYPILAWIGPPIRSTLYIFKD